MSKDIKELLKEATKDLLSPESLVAIQEAIDAKAVEKTQLQVEAALVAQDDKHATMLTSLMEKMDADYTAKLQKLVQRLDESYAAKLVKVKDYYDGKVSQLNEQLETAATKYVGDLTSKIDTFLESRMDEMLPEAKLNEAVENVKAVRILEKIRGLVGIDENTISSDVKSAMADGKRQIDESTSEVSKLVVENAQLKASLAQKEVEILLEQKTSKLPAKKREHVKRVLSGKDVTFINENLSYVSQMFDREEVLESEKALKTTKKLGTEVDTPVIIEESVKSVEDPNVAIYLQGLK